MNHDEFTRLLRWAGIMLSLMTLGALLEGFFWQWIRRRHVIRKAKSRSESIALLDSSGRWNQATYGDFDDES